MISCYNCGKKHMGEHGWRYRTIGRKAYDWCPKCNSNESHDHVAHPESAQICGVCGTNINESRHN